MSHNTATVVSQNLWHLYQMVMKRRFKVATVLEIILELLEKPILYMDT